jgi:predicted molibdopterin-dependent oxidoreductase YjgC
VGATDNGRLRPAIDLRPGWYGRTMARRTRSYPRLRHPLVRDRKGGALRQASWDEALDRAAAGFAAIRDRDGGQALGVFSCSKSTNEMNYAAQKLARLGFGSNNIDSCNRT